MTFDEIFAESAIHSNLIFKTKITDLRLNSHNQFKNHLKR